VSLIIHADFMLIFVDSGWQKVESEITVEK